MSNNEKEQSIVSQYKQYVRKPAKNQVVRLDQEHFKKIEVLRAIHSNVFTVASTAEIIRVALEYYVDNVIDKDDRHFAEVAVREVMLEE